MKNDSERAASPTSRGMVWASGISLSVIDYYSTFSGGVPTLYRPLPLLTILPAFMLSGLGSPFVYLPILIPPLLFFSWNPKLLKGSDKFPLRTLILMGVLAGLSIWWFIGGWHDGEHYQGRTFVLFTCWVNVAWFTTLLVLGTLSVMKRSFLLNVAVHWLLFAWLAWYAFPYLGELP